MSTNTQTNKCPDCPTCSGWSTGAIVTIIVLGLVIISLIVGLVMMGRKCALATGESFALGLNKLGNLKLNIG